MSYDGIQFGNRVDTLTQRKLYAKVVDNILNSATLGSKLMSAGEEFMGKTADYTVKVVDSQQGQFVAGLETLNSAASDTTVTMSFAHTAFMQPIVFAMTEAFANAGSTGVINLQSFKMDEAAGEAKNRIGKAVYGTGAGNQPLGLGALVDDGTSTSSLGGLTRATYTTLNSTVTASSGTISLSKMATLHDSASAAGIESEEPTLGVTTKAVWSNIEQLLYPSVRSNYEVMLPVKGAGNQMLSREALRGVAGFTALSYRGIPIIKDDACTSGVLFFLNENYIKWLGRTLVPREFEGILEKTDLGQPSTVEGVLAAPYDTYGFFHQKEAMVINQGAMIGRIWVFGQMITTQPRRHAKLTGITGI
jgi:hypothetical protein